MSTGPGVPTVMVALLRGINVGGKNRLPMATLREIAHGCGYDDVRTYIQSGNLVLRSTESPQRVSERLRAAITDATGLTPAVMIRTRAEMQTVVDGNPYLARSDDPTHHHVVFGDHGLEDALTEFDPDRYAPESATAVGRDVYLFLPDGMGRSKLAVDVGRRKSLEGTARNWRTVTTLLAMCDELD